MTAKKSIDSIRQYSTDEEWRKMSDSTKQRYANLKENYDLMVKHGLRPQVLMFMKKPSRPTNKKGDRDALSPMAAVSAEMEPGHHLAVGKASSKFVKDENRTHQEATALPKMYAYVEELQASSEEASCDLSSMKVLRDASLSQPCASEPVQGHANHERFQLASDDDTLLCDDCQAHYPGDCPSHGPLIYVKDTPVPSGDALRAMKTLPDGLAIRRTTIRGTGYGVYATKPLPKRLCFGPYEGVLAETPPPGSSSQQEQSGRVERSADRLTLGRSNWMRYVNRSTGPEHHNLVAFKRAGAVYYRTCKAIGTYEELLVSFNASETVNEHNTAGAVPVVSTETPQEGAASRSSISCEMCGDRFTSYEYFLRHQLRQHAVRPTGKYKCSQCNYSNNNKFLTAQHEWSHRGEKPFSCQICDRSFSWKSSLHCHLTSHTREKPFECAVCGERFTCSSHMLRHQKVHTEHARPFVCPICEKGYARRDYLKVHIRTHTAEKLHACCVCGRRFTDRSNAKRHEMTVHAKEFPLSCPHCAKGFASRREVRRHVLVHHEHQRDP